MDAFWKFLLIAGMAAPAILMARVFTVAYRSRGAKRAVRPFPLAGAVGFAVSDLTPSGAVMIDGELWAAIAVGGGNLEKGADIKVLGPRGHQLAVAVLPKS